MSEMAQVLICEKCQKMFLNALEQWTPNRPLYICLGCRNYIAPKERCSKGHPLVGSNLVVDKTGLNHCRTCDADYQHAYNKWTSTRDPKVKQPRPTHCRKGHEYTPENSYFHPSSGARSCRTCSREKNRAWRAASAAADKKRSA